MAGKLKLDPKKLAVDHGEKIAFGLIVVLVLVALVTTNWVPYGKEPEEITEKVTRAQEKLAQSVWPEEEKAKYALTPEKQPREIVVASLETPLLVTPYYAPSQKMTKPLNELDSPLQEPELVPVTDLLATNARVFVRERDEPATPAGATDGESSSEEGSTGGETTPKPRNDLDEFGGGGTVAGSVGGAGSLGGYGAGDGASGLAMAMGGAGSRDYGSMEAPELAMGAAYGTDYYLGMMGGEEGMEGMPGGMGLGANMKGRGYPFVSVRGVFAFREQVRKFAEAIHRSPTEAYRTFEIIDFELQRQVLEVSPDQWSDWTAVNTEVLRDVIKSAAGLAPDPVQSAVTDTAITCPLPQRVFGIWNNQATHPKLQEFELSEAEMDNELKYQYALLKSFKEQNKALPDTGVQKRGFSDLLFDTRQLEQGMMGLESPFENDAAMGMMQGMGSMGMNSSMMGGVSGTGMMSPGMGGATGSMQASAVGNDATYRQFAETLLKELSDDEKDKKLREYISKRAKAAGSLLLYRYLDFNVVPGRTYRYRVRLELRNPNYKQNIMSAGGVAQVVDGATRMTPWSEPTKPTTVEDTVKYFVSRIEPARVRLHPEVRMHVFQYDETLGTTVEQQVNVPYGQNVGGKAKAQQVDPAHQTNEEKDYVFKSNDVLVDSMADITFASSLHPDLKLPPNARSQAGIPEHALVVTQDHRLKDLDPVSQKNDLASMEDYMGKQKDFFASLIQRQTPADLGEGSDSIAEMYQQIYGGDAMGGMEEMAGGGGRRARGRSPLARGSMGMSGGGMSGMMPPPPVGSQRPGRSGRGSSQSPR